MWRRLISDETGYTHERFFTSYFINGRVFLYLLFISHLKICFRIDLVCVLATIRDTSVVTGLIHVYNYYTKIQGPRFEGNYTMMRTWHINSIIVKNKLHAHHKAHLHTILFTPVIAFAY